MKTLSDGSSIIVVGGWNPQIFSPTWIKKHVCEIPDCDVELAFSVENPTAPPRLSFEDSYLFVTPTKLEIRPKNNDIDSFAKCSQSLGRILKTLSHTPLLSFGVNFAFAGSKDDCDEIIANFTFVDSSKFNVAELQLKQTFLQRTFRQPNNSVLNLSLTIKDEEVVISFNYHKDLNKASDCAIELTAELVQSQYAKSVDILSEVYGVQIEEDDQE